MNDENTTNNSGEELADNIIILNDEDGNEVKFEFLDLIKYSLFKDMSVTKLPSSLEEQVKYAVSFDGNIRIFNKIVESLLNLKNQIRYDSNPALSVKVTFIQIIKE